MNTLVAIVKQVVKEPYMVKITTTTTIEDADGVIIESNVKSREEWRVDLIVDEDFVGEKAVTLSFPNKEKAEQVKASEVAYNL